MLVYPAHEFRQFLFAVLIESKQHVPFAVKPLLNNPCSFRPGDRGVLNTLREKEKTLVTIIFSSSNNNFYPAGNKVHFLSYLYFVTLTCLQLCFLVESKTILKYCNLVNRYSNPMVGYILPFHVSLQYTERRLE